MNYLLTEEQHKIKDLFRRIAREEVAPVALDLDRKEEFPHHILARIREEGAMGLYLPYEYGGMGGGVFELCIAMEELSRECAGVGVSFAANALATFPIHLFGTEEQKKRYLTSVAKGEKLAAFALTEPGAGSDASGIVTTARKDGNSYILNGMKQWITNGGEADIYTIIAATDRSKGGRGISAFIVERGCEGFGFGRKEKKLGIKCSTTMELTFTDCRIPAENLLGREGMGFIVVMKTLDKARPGVGAQGVGIAQGALDEVLKFVEERQRRGVSPSELESIRHRVADMATVIEAARSLVYSVARAIDAGQKSYSRESAMAKLFASDVAVKVANDALEIIGMPGLREGGRIEKIFRDAKITQIYEGTNEIQRGIIALDLIKSIRKKIEGEA